MHCQTFYFHNAIQKLPFQSKISLVILNLIVHILVTEKSTSHFTNLYQLALTKILQIVNINTLNYAVM